MPHFIFPSSINFLSPKHFLLIALSFQLSVTGLFAFADDTSLEPTTLEQALPVQTLDLPKESSPKGFSAIPEAKSETKISVPINALGRIFKVKHHRFITPKGELAFEGDYLDIHPFSEGLACALAPSSSPDQAPLFGYLNPQGQWVIPPQFVLAGDFKEGLARVQIGGQWGYIDKNGLQAIAPGFDGADDFSEGLAAVVLDEWFGFIDRTGKLVIPNRFKAAERFSEGLAKVLIPNTERPGLPDQLGFIKPNGDLAFMLEEKPIGVPQPELIRPAKYDDVSDFHKGRALVTQRSNINETEPPKFGYIDPTGKPAIIPHLQWAADFMPTSTLSASGQSNGKTTPNKKTTGTSSHSGSWLAIYKLNNRYGAMDATGKAVILHQYDWLGAFSEGLAPVKVNGKFGFVDPKGKVVIQPQFEWVGEFQNGLAPAASRNLANAETTKLSSATHYGYIDKTGQWAIPPRYRSAQPFTAGVAQVGELISP